VRLVLTVLMLLSIASGALPVPASIATAASTCPCAPTPDAFCGGCCCGDHGSDAVPAPDNDCNADGMSMCDCDLLPNADGAVALTTSVADPTRDRAHELATSVPGTPSPTTEAANRGRPDDRTRPVPVGPEPADHGIWLL